MAYRSLALALGGLTFACQGPPAAPVASPDGGSGAVGPQLAAGAHHMCAIFGAGAVRCWGEGSLGQLGRAAGGDPLGTYSVDLGAGRRAVSVYAGLSGSCVILDDGAVKCWGDNSFGQLGLGDTVPRGDGTGAMGDALPVVDLGRGRRAVALALGSTATCALLDDGAVKCWGDPYQGATGHGDIFNRGDRPGTMGDNLRAMDLGSRDGAPFKVKAIAAFDYHSFCAILDDTGPDNSGLKCWGSNDYCELGLGTPESRGADPATIGNGLEWVDLGATSAGRKRKAVALGGGYQSTCVLGDDGAVSCWGSNLSGELGNGDSGGARSCAPHEVGDANVITLADRAIAVAARGQPEGEGAHTCAVLAGGAVTCWGENGWGQLGTGGTAPLLRPSAPLGFPDGFAPGSLVLGNKHSCAISDGGRVKCWGSNGQGQLGPDSVGDRLAPGPDLRLRGRVVLDLAAGGDHTCAILKGGALRCWGRNGDGQLGLGDLGNRGDAAGEMGDGLPDVPLGDAAVSVAAGAAHSCAVTAAGLVKCWGAGAAGQLGQGNRAAALVPPSAAVSLPGRAIAVAAGADFSCALLASGQAACWGAGGRGQLGTGETSDVAAPAGAISFSAGATALVAGGRHACAFLTNGQLACWGANDKGQLGAGDAADRSRPEVVRTLAGRVQGVAAGGDTTCVRLEGGAVRCWGANERGQLGLGDVLARPAPEARGVDLGAGRVAAGLAVGGAFSCALLGTGQAKCWGDNGAAQLGAAVSGPAYGDGPNETGDFLPEAVQGGGRSLRVVVAGRAHACAILDTSDVRCWGDNGQGQLGVGDAQPHSAFIHPTGAVDLGAAP